MLPIIFTLQAKLLKFSLHSYIIAVRRVYLVGMNWTHPNYALIHAKQDRGREKSFLFFFSQAPDGESQPSTEVDLFISTEKIMVLNTDLKVNLKFKWCSFEILIKCIGICSERTDLKTF